VADNTPAPKGSPRQVFGEALRFYRKRAELALEDIAPLVHLSVSTIRAYEDGRRVPQRQTIAEIEAIPAMNADGALLMLWDQFEAGMTYQVFPDWVQDWIEAIEPFASALRWYEPSVIPALLQTEDYMRAVFSTRFGINSDEIEDKVQSRLMRQRRLLEREDPPALWFILDYAVLVRPVGGRHVMGEQISRLIEAARQPNIRIEIIPEDTGAHEGLAGAFVIADFDDKPSVGYQEGAVRGLPLKDRKDVASLELTWTTLRGESLPRGASLANLEETAKTWTSLE
jgi:transcriptional regulator with XRE-family HTH domain